MSNKQISLIFTFIILCFAVVAVRLFFIQIWHYEEINYKVNKTVCKILPEQSPRGNIFDKNGKILATSLKTYSLFADMTVLKDPASLVSSLKQIGVEIESLQQLSNPNLSFCIVAKNLSYENVNNIKSLKMKGIGFLPSYQRQYPENLACHLLGVVGKDDNGLEGVELALNQYLTGEKTKQSFRRDGRGKLIGDKLTDLDKYSGADVYLTIDRNLQFIAEQEIEKAWLESKAKRATVVIQDPNTGEILAVASRPSFDQLNFAESLKNLKNPALADVLEPGSTFKIITAAAALEEKIVKRSEVIWCEDGSYKIFDHTINDHEKKGLLTFDQILECSSNIGTAKIGIRLGKQNLYKYARQFGFGSKTGIDLPGEAKGILRPPDKWDGLSLPTISFGQGIGATPMQVINAYSSIANGGELLEPQIVKKVTNSSGEVLEKSERKVIRRTVSEQTAKQLREMLIGVVENGTGELAKIHGYLVGGKTGTAQKRDPKTNKYSSTDYTASFCGIVPADKPALTILVLLDEPKGDYYAATRAVPVFTKIAYKALSYLRISPNSETVCLANVKRLK